jgi:tetratricopeptide (TPR) repeat protein
VATKTRRSRSTSNWWSKTRTAPSLGGGWGVFTSARRTQDTRVKIGVIYFEKGDYERAATEFTLVLASEPDNDRVRYYLASVYSELKDDERAIDELRRIPEDSEYYADACAHIGYILQRQGRLDEAIVFVKKARQVEPENPDLGTLLASLYREKGDLEGAIRLMEALLEKDQDNSRYHFTLGALYDEAKDKDASIDHMRRAIELDPKNAAALNYLGYTFAEMGKHLDEAEELIRRALAIAPNDGFYIDSLGWVFYQRGEYEQAVEQLERALELAGDDPTIAEHLADAYRQTHRVHKALSLYHEALRRVETDDQADRIRNKIQTLEGRLPGDRGS